MARRDPRLCASFRAVSGEQGASFATEETLGHEVLQYRFKQVVRHFRTSGCHLGIVKRGLYRIGAHPRLPQHLAQDKRPLLTTRAFKSTLPGIAGRSTRGILARALEIRTPIEQRVIPSSGIIDTACALDERRELLVGDLFPHRERTGG